METKLGVLSCYVFSILTYGSECWAISRIMEKMLQAPEMWFYQWMLRISWMDHICNEEILNRLGRNRLCLCAIRICQQKFLGHIMQKESLGKVVLTGKNKGKRYCVKQRLTCLDTIDACLGRKKLGILHMAGNRGR